MAANGYGTQTQYGQLASSVISRPSISRPSISRPLVTIPIWLRDTYARVHSTPINNFQGLMNEDAAAEDAARDAVTRTDSELFLSGGDVFTYLNRNLSRNLCDQTVTIVIHSLRDLYWNIRQTLPREEVNQLEIALRYPLPRFKDIFEYSSLEALRDTIPSPLYQLFGTLTPFSVIHIPVRHFIDTINRGNPIRVALTDTDIVIELHYEAYDFWDPSSESLVTHIDINSRC